MGRGLVGASPAGQAHDRARHRRLHDGRVRVAVHVGARRHRGRRVHGADGAGAVRPPGVDVRRRSADRCRRPERRALADRAARHPPRLLGLPRIPLPPARPPVDRSPDAGRRDDGRVAPTVDGARSTEPRSRREPRSRSRCLAYPRALLAPLAIRRRRRLRGRDRGEVVRGDGDPGRGAAHVPVGDDEAAPRRHGVAGGRSCGR